MDETYPVSTLFLSYLLLLDTYNITLIPYLYVKGWCLKRRKLLIMVVLLLYSIRSVDSGRELRYFLYQGSHNSLL